MSRLRDILAPVLAAVLIIAVALGVLTLLRVANSRGTDALIAAKVSQVAVTASSFDARYAGQLTSSASLGGTGGGNGFELRPHSAIDQKILDTFQVALEPGTGVLLLDAHDTITAGLLLNPRLLGTRYAAPGWSQLKAELATRPMAIGPVTNGVTSGNPVYSYVLGIRGATGSLRGSIVVEMPVSPTSSLQAEIARLDQPGSSDEWLLLDSFGTVVASSTGLGIAQPADPRYVSAPAGRMDVGSRVVVTANVPTLGWRLVFAQKRSELAQPLSAPLQDAGLALMVLVLLIGLILSVFLVRRRSAHRLRELDQMKTVFLATASHELRTPVAIITGFSELLAERAESASQEEVRDFADTILSNARQLDALTEELLDLTHIDLAGAPEPDAVIDLGNVVSYALESHPHLTTDHELQLDLPTDPTPVNGSQKALERILVNLVGNAAKYSPERTRITVSVRRERDQVRLIVDDQGPGVPPEQREQVFARFFRGTGDVVTRTRGTGVGLAIVAEYAAKMSAKVSVDSAPGGGARFSVCFPVAVIPSGAGGRPIPAQSDGAEDVSYSTTA
jgi:signal transduction histidine kinase